MGKCTLSRTVLIDADICAMESACNGEKRYDWEDGDDACVVVDQQKAEQNLNARIETIRQTAEADRVVICLSDPGRRYFRHDLYPEYKSNRKGTPPELLGAMKEKLMRDHDHYWKPGLEADDVLGILATTDRVVRGEKVIASSDKDLRQIPGLLLDPRKLDDGLVEIAEEDGVYWHMEQTLLGDVVDGYPGCKGIGPKKAAKAFEGLRGAVELWQKVVEVFESKGFTEEDALLQARLARILQASDWNFERKEMILWNPPQ